MFWKVSLAAALCAGAFSAVTLSAANADTLYSNLSATAASSDPIADANPFDSFSAGDTAEPLTGLTLLLSASNLADGGSLNVNLYADSSNSPGGLIASLGTIDDSQLSTSLADFTVSLADNPLLAADTLYWIGLTATDSSASWGWAADDTGTNIADELHKDFGTIYCNSSFGGCNSAVSPEPYIMEVDGSPAAPVPEPASFVLLGTGLALGLVFARKRPFKNAGH